MVNGLGLDVSEEELRCDFENLAEEAGAHRPSQVMHRDFQSRNLMVFRERLWLIDFQGMRFGPSIYDLASLLLDPYVMLPPPMQKQLAKLYWSASRSFLGCSYGEFCNQYRFVRLCRNLQVLGAYGHLGLTMEKKHFLQYIPGAYVQLYQWIHGPCRRFFPKLERWIERGWLSLASRPDERFGRVVPRGRRNGLES
jgi:aminoglycoside/choline kinase family phosphotransferase